MSVDAPAGAPTTPAPHLPLPLYKPWLTNVILGVNLFLFLALSLVSRGGFMEAVLGGASADALVLFGAKANELILDGQYWRLLTPVFLHIGLVHLLFNQYALHLFGREVETLFGPPRFAALYLLSGMFGSLASFAFSAAISAGASGAIFGIIGAMAAFLLRNRKLLGEGGKQHLRSLLVLIGINLFLGMTIPGIDNLGHLGGLISGVLLGFALSPTYELERSPVPPFARVIERRPLLPPAAMIALALLLLAGGTTLALQIAPLR